MSIRALIAYQNKQGKVTSVYHHQGGKPEGLGAHLLEQYDNETAVKKLVSGGDMSSCRNEPPSYYSDGENWAGVKPKTYKSADAFRRAMKPHTAEYAYIFSGGVWSFVGDGIGDRFQLLKGWVLSHLEKE